MPLFIGFIEAGVPPGVTFSFLITSPLVNKAAVAVLWATLGFKATALYVMSGVIVGVLGGYIIDWLKLEKYVAGFVYDIHSQPVKEAEMTSRQRLDYAVEEVKSIVGRIWIYVLTGVSLCGISHGFVSILTANIAAYFVESDREDESADIDMLVRKINELSDKIDEIDRKVSENERVKED